MDKIKSCFLALFNISKVYSNNNLLFELLLESLYTSNK